MASPKSLLVCGTTSDAGKTLVTTALCRAFVRRGVSVAPFKSQNMSNNSMVCADGSEIGRAQWVQALAARTPPEAAMNPVLLKPGGDQESHVVVMGQPAGRISSREFAGDRTRLRDAAYAAFDDLRGRVDVVVAEGAGSPAEINLRSGDYINMGLARHGRVPTIVVADIDRGGAFAALYGTVALLDEADRSLVAGFVMNKFRGDARLLAPGLEELTRRTGRQFYGTMPWSSDVWLDSEDALELAARRPEPSSATARVAVIRLPRISNFTDVDALGLEPSLEVVFATSPAAIADADLLVVPGTRATLADLSWLRERGLDRAIAEHVASGRPVLGVCGGFQMLGEHIGDPEGVEGRARAAADGLGLLDVRTRFASDKTLKLSEDLWRGIDVHGYEIHHGRMAVGSGDPFPGGVRTGMVWGTMWHGALEDDAFRRAWLAAALPDHNPGVPVSFSDARHERLDLLGDLAEEHLDVEALLDLATGTIQPPFGGVLS